MENKKDFTRKHILQAAFECFSEYGYTKTSFIDIAKKAEISRSLLYVYFNDKKDLFITMTGEIHDRCVVRSQEILDSDLSKKEKLRRIMDIWLIDIHRIIDKSPNPNSWVEALKSVKQSEIKYRELFAKSLAPLLGKDLAEIVVLSIKGFVDDKPSFKTLEKRTNTLIDNLA